MTVAQREQERARFTGWDNIPEVRALQEKSWNVYVSTGRWDTAEQAEWSRQAQQARQNYNPAYNPELYKYGPTNKEEANQIYLPSSPTPNVNKVEQTGSQIVTGVAQNMDGLLGIGLVIGLIMLLKG